MNTRIPHTGTVKFLGTTVLVGTLFATLTGCTSEDTVAEPAATVDNGTPAAGEPASESREEFEAQFVRAVDGDTIEVTRADTEESVTIRLLGIDAPEADACGGPESTAFLADFVAAGDTLVIEYDAEADTEDQYERTLAYASTFGATTADLGSHMVREGYAAAWFPQGEPTPEKFDAYDELATTAMDQESGLWAECDEMGR